MPNKKVRRSKLGRFAYQVKVSLAGVKPPIWRRLLARDNTDLHKFHLIIQDAMGWQNCHLYQFEIEETRYTEFSDADFIAEDEIPASSARLGDLALREGDWFVYNYDFGDDWYHECEVEKITPFEPGAEYPRHVGRGSRGERFGRPDRPAAAIPHRDLILLGSIRLHAEESPP